MKLDTQGLEVRLAAGDRDVAAAQRLRYRVFVQEMGAAVSLEDHAAQLERDAYDRHFDHLLLIDTAKPAADGGPNVVGAYRLMRDSAARRGIGFYGAQEYDLSKLMDSGRKTLELGRSCVARAYRGGLGMHLLWDALAAYVERHEIEILFGVASFHSIDVAPIAQALSYLHYAHLAPPDLRVRAINSAYVPLDQLPREQVVAKQARLQIPPLIKAYLRLGGFVGDGAYIDHDFNTVDVCLLMDTNRMVARYRDYYTRKRGLIR